MEDIQIKSEEVHRGFFQIDNDYSFLYQDKVQQRQSLPNQNLFFVQAFEPPTIFFDHALSGIWSYNPLHYDINDVPMSIMIKDLLTTYKLGWKTSYYQNTYDYKGEEETVQPQGIEDTVPEQAEELSSAQDEELCDACAI